MKPPPVPPPATTDVPPAAVSGVGHYENFPVASWLVPARLRPAIVAIYRFARSADDIADEGDAPAAERIAALQAYRARLDAIGAGDDRADDPLFGPLAAAIARHRLPIAPLRDLLDAFEQDVSRTRWPDEALLLDYCRRSANPVGRLMLALFDEDTPANLERSDAICTALQLVNFLQDVSIDWRRGRLYLPLDELAAHGASEADVADAVDRGQPPSSALRNLLAHRHARARALLVAGSPLVTALPGRFGLEIAATVAGAARILDRVAAADYDTARARPALRGTDWLMIAFHALLRRPLR